MVATTLAIAAGSAVAANVACRKFVPKLVADPRLDAAIKAAVGLGAILASMKVKSESGKAALVGVGAGLIACGAQEAFPALA